MEQQNYTQIDLSQWKQAGEGGNGKTYVNPDRPGLILKVNNSRLSTLEAVRHEYQTSKAVERMGLPIPKVYEIVKVGDAYATLSEFISGKRSLSRICCDEPARVEEMARLLCAKGKELFATPCDTAVFPSRREQLMRALDGSPFFGRKILAKVRAFAQTIPENTGCIHGDFQTGNLIMSGDKLYWLDLDRFAHGDPMFDIGHLYQICKVYGKMKRVQDLFHMDLEQFDRFWDAFAKAYTGKDDYSGFEAAAGKFAALDIILRTVFVTPSFAEKLFFRLHVGRLVRKFY